MSRAGVSFELIDRGVPSDGTVSATGFRGFTLRLTSDSGLITAVDFSGIDGFTGPLVQRWTSSNSDGIYDTPSPGFLIQQNLDVSANNFDSHFLVPLDLPGVAITGSAPNEDATIGPTGSAFFSFPPNTSDFGFGFGSNLKAAYGILGSKQSATLDVAYLVVPDGQDLSFTARVATRSGTFPLVGGTPIPLTWNPPSNDWNTSASNQNWLHGTTSSAFTPGANVAFTDSGLTAGGAVNVDPTGLHVGNVSFSNTSGRYTLTGGAINAIGRMTKTGAGTVVLNNNGSYAGGIAVNAGTLVVNGTLSPGVGVTAGGTVAGTGTITGGISTVGGKIAPGDGIGSLTFSSLRIENATLEFELGSTGSDRINTTSTSSTGFVTGGSNNTVKIVDAGGAHAGSYILIDYAGPAPNLASFVLASTSLGPYHLSLVNNPINTSIDVQLLVQQQWALDADGNWSTAANWAGGEPDGIDAAAYFGAAITAPRRVTVDVPRTVNELNFDSPISYTLSGTSLLTFDSAAGLAAINSVRGNHVIEAPVKLNQRVTVSVQSPDDVLTISGPITSAGGLTKSSAGTLKLTGDNFYSGTTLIDGGTLIVDGSHRGGVSYSVTSHSTLSGNGTIDAHVDVSAGSVVDPGDPFGTLRVGGLSLQNSILKFDFNNGSMDEIILTGADQLSLFGESSVYIRPFTSIGGSSYTLIDYTGPPLANLDGLILATPELNGRTASLYNDIFTTSILLVFDDGPIPEPCTLGLTIAGLSGLFRPSRRWMAGKLENRPRPGETI